MPIFLWIPSNDEEFFGADNFSNCISSAIFFCADISAIFALIISAICALIISAIFALTISAIFVLNFADTFGYFGLMKLKIFIALSCDWSVSFYSCKKILTQPLMVEFRLSRLLYHFCLDANTTLLYGLI